MIASDTTTGRIRCSRFEVVTLTSADTALGVVLFDVVAEETPHRRGSRESPPGIGRDARVFDQRAVAKLDAQRAGAFIVADRAQVAGIDALHLHARSPAARASAVTAGRARHGAGSGR